MGNTSIPVVDSFRYLAKLIQYFKVKKKKTYLVRWIIKKKTEIDGTNKIMLGMKRKEKWQIKQKLEEKVYFFQLYGNILEI